MTARSPWIVSAGFDALFFVATPLLCAGLLLPLRGTFTSLQIWIVVMSFSSFGHHLPGFLRAYGDPELFARFRLRFLLAPPLLFAAFVWFGLRSLHGLALTLVLWSIWHVAMQHYGFMRIYDAKRGARSRVGARMDWVVSLTWFVAIVLWSPQYSLSLLGSFFDSGLAFIPVWLFHGLRAGATLATVAVTTVYVLYVLRALRAGEPVSLVKLALLVITIAFLYLVWVGIGDILLGLAVWEVFHDLQYFALTWVYNRSLLKKGAARSRALRLFFGPGRAVVFVYAGAILLYGGFNYGVVQIEAGTLQTVLMAFVFTSTILHYYYDGFIWKVRQQRTRQGLDLERLEEPAPETAAPRSSRMLPHLVHAALFAVPIGSLAVAEMLAPERTEVELRSALRDLVPDEPLAHTNLALAYSETGLVGESEASYRRALELDPHSAVALDGLAVLLLESAAPEAGEEAEELLRRAIAEDPLLASAHVNLGNVHARRGEMDEARRLFERALELDDALPGAYSSLSRVYASLGRDEDARSAREKALRSGHEGHEHDGDPAGEPDVLVRGRLALEAERAGRHGEAADHYLAVLAGDEPPVELRKKLVQNLILAQRGAEAVPHLRVLAAHDAQDLSYELLLAEILATDPDPLVRRGGEALRLAQGVVAALGARSERALAALAAAQAENGQFDLAVETQSRALRAAQAAQVDGAALRELEKRLELYRAGKPYREGAR